MSDIIFRDIPATSPFLLELVTMAGRVAVDFASQHAGDMPKGVRRGVVYTVSVHDEQHHIYVYFTGRSIVVRFTEMEFFNV